MFSHPAVKAALIAVFTATSLGTNYAMIALPNVKIMDALVFIAAFLFGLSVGTGVAVSTWAVYGFVNPYGQAGFPLILFLMIGECFYAIGGSGLRKTSIAKQLLVERDSPAHLAYVFGIVGLVSTFAYDVLTNFASYVLLVGSLYQAFLIGMITGALFSLVHELSNLVFFATVVPAAIVASKRLGVAVGAER